MEVFHKIWEVFGHYFFKCSFCSFLSYFSWTHTCTCWSAWWYIKFCSLLLLFFFFLLLRLDNFNCPILKFIDSSFFLLISIVEHLVCFFSVQLLYFLAPELLSGSIFYNLYLFTAMFISYWAYAFTELNFKCTSLISNCMQMHKKLCILLLSSLGYHEILRVRRDL